MRAVAGAALLLLAGCRREPSFDERYASAEHAILATAASIDAELAARASEGAEAEAATRTGALAASGAPGGAAR